MPLALGSGPPGEQFIHLPHLAVWEPGPTPALYPPDGPGRLLGSWLHRETNSFEREQGGRQQLAGSKVEFLSLFSTVGLAPC